MTLVLRALLALSCLGLATFCVFGFQATYEPMEGREPLIWRAGYAGLGVASLVWGVQLLKAGRKRRRKSGPASHAVPPSRAAPPQDLSP